MNHKVQANSFTWQFASRDTAALMCVMDMAPLILDFLTLCLDLAKS